MDTATAALDRAVAGFGAGGEARSGQLAMAEAVERAIATGRHLVVQAGTGTGKSLAYLVPAICSGKRVVVATATKALQDQLMGKDLPFLERHLGVPFTFACLKGRSNYACVQRAREAASSNDEQLALDGLDDPGVGAELRKLLRWITRQLDVDTNGAGERAGLAFEPSPKAWGAVSVTSRECPGATRCPAGDVCFCEAARDAAAAADVIVVNTHLYGMHLNSEGSVLPEHDVVVFDEAHTLEDVIAATAGLELGAGRFTYAAGAVRAVIADDDLVAAMKAAGQRFADALFREDGRRLRTIAGDLAESITRGRAQLERALAALRKVDSDAVEVKSRTQRAVRFVTGLIDDLDAVVDPLDTEVVWVEGGASGFPVLKLAPVDVRPVLQALWANTTAVLTSATLPPTTPMRLGVPSDHYDYADVGSPFDYQTNAILYCAAHLPDRTSDAYEAAMHDELTALIEAAGGRTLALFTSWRAMRAAVEALRPRLSFPLLAQNDLPKPALAARFAKDEATCLFATMGFWQGVDVVGRSLSLVTIDRLPFPRPDEPLTQARREQARANAFELVDLPRATTLLAQGVGRLIRSSSDRGVVAVLDPRLASGRYRWTVVNALPPMRRTKLRDEVLRFLRSLHDLQEA
ncbi:MAG: ATP-dependent DNA helicase [Acidimicrobiales bacterium]